MDKTKAINPSKKLQMTILVLKYRDYKAKYGNDVDRNWGAQQIRDQISCLAINWVLSEVDDNPPDPEWATNYGKFLKHNPASRVE